MSKFSTEEKVRIVLDGMRYPEGITGLCQASRHFTEHLLSLAKDATGEGERRAYFTEERKA